jgi:pimeloyl-ACP methyl ester carboxylesterase
MQDKFTTDRATLGEIYLTYDTFGFSNRTTIVLIHGLGTQRIGWPDTFCNLLANKGFYVIRFDNRDIGQSVRLDSLGSPKILWMMFRAMVGLPVKSAYSLQDMAQDTVSLLDHLQVDKAHFVGASMGGMIAQRIAAGFPQRTLSLTSIMSSSGRRGLPGASGEIKAHFMSSPKSDTKVDFINHGIAQWQLISSKRYPPDPTVLATFIKRSVERGHPSLGGVDRQFAAIIADGSRVELLRTIVAPTLVLHGDEDPLLPAACGKDTASYIENSKYELIEGMGHDLPAQLHKYLTNKIAEHCLSSMPNNEHVILDSKK